MPLDVQEVPGESKSYSYDYWARNTLDSAPELKFKKLRSKVFEDSGIDSEYDKESDAKWKPIDKRRVIKTPDPRRRVRLTSKIEISTGIGVSNGEERYGEGAEQSRSLSE